MIDGHVDLPIYVREMYANDIRRINLEKLVRGKLKGACKRFD